MRLICLALVLSVAAFAPASAGAAKLGTTKLSYDDVDFGSGCGAPGPTCIFMQKGLPDAKTRAPFSGKIVKWQVVVPGGTQLQLVVMHKRKNGRYEATHASAMESPLNPAVYKYETKLRIKRGDYIAIHGSSLAGQDNPGGVRAGFNSPLEIGVPRKPDYTIAEDQWLYNATVKR